MATTYEGDFCIMKPRIAILKTDGTNCDQETAYAFAKAGGIPDIIPLNQLKKGTATLEPYSILAIPGGFSYGDDIASGKVFALELALYAREQLQRFVERGNLIIGICNGFQVLVQLGLLPFNSIGIKRAALLHNDSATFECRWITLRIEKSLCLFTRQMEETLIELQVAHGEGKLYVDDTTLAQIEQMNLVAVRYTHNGLATQEYPHNPNGSRHAIAGLCDPTGRIFGLMPHPERFVEPYHHPNWRNQKNNKPQGLCFFENAIAHVK
jgi:phosphoribosylformylglycinamidine synthase subunit PurQ / glutaminase